MIAEDHIRPTVINVFIQNCEIEGYLEGNTETATTFYISRPGVGVYTIQNNTLNDTVCVANGAGNAMKSGESAKILGNTITNGALYFNGKRNSGLDPDSLTNLPIIEGNALGIETAKINDADTAFFIHFCDVDTIKLLFEEQMKAILSKNTLTGYLGGKSVDASEKSHEASLRYLVPDGVGIVPGTNMPGVTWTGDAKSGYTLTISKGGSYKLMDDFIANVTGVMITADDVIFDGNGKK